MKKLFIGLLLLCTISFVPVASQVASAQNPLDAACSDSRAKGADMPTACKETGGQNPLYGSGSLLNNIANGVALVGGAIAVIYMILGGFKMITSSGDSQGFGEGRKTLIYGAVGLIILSLARAIVGFVLGRLA